MDPRNHDVPLDVFRRWCLVEELALQWFYSYLNDRMQITTAHQSQHPKLHLGRSSNMHARYQRTDRTDTELDR